MLDQALTALAASGGTALAQAARTDAWTSLRQELARWFGRGDAQREQAEDVALGQDFADEVLPAGAAIPVTYGRSGRCC